MKKIRMSKVMKKEVALIVGGIYSMNSSHTKGYLFCWNGEDGEILVGMFCTKQSEIEPDVWDYYYQYKDKCLYKLKGDL